MKILFVDDDADDVELFCEAVDYLNESDLVQQNSAPVECMTVDDGQQALNFLACVEPLPDLIFLDINMPIMDGRTCLSALKENDRLAKIPVVMFSTAYRDQDDLYFQSMGAQECRVIYKKLF
jgi:CheY-like chemotaxis protein